MKVAVVGGTAGLGYGMAVRFAHLGVEVAIGSRTEEKGASAAEKVQSVAGGTVSGSSNPSVVGNADLVVVAVPFVGQAGIYKSIKPSLRGSCPVLDCTVPLASEVGGRPTKMLGVWEGSAAEQAKGILGEGIDLASGFHTVMAGLLEDISAPVNGDILICGDRPAKAVVQELVDLLAGARYVDCGPLPNARILESMTALLIGLNRRYKTSGAGIRVTNLPDPKQT